MKKDYRTKMRNRKKEQVKLKFLHSLRSDSTLYSISCEHLGKSGETYYTKGCGKHLRFIKKQGNKKVRQIENIPSFGGYKKCKRGRLKNKLY